MRHELQQLVPRQSIHLYSESKGSLHSLIWGVILLIACLGLLVACGPRRGPFTEYYVSVLGNDVSGDGSATNPWRTIQFALDNADYSGDVPQINIRKGIYREELTITRSVVINGAGMGSGVVSTNPDNPLLPIQDVTLISRVFGSDARGHQIRGNIRVDMSNVDFHWGKVRAEVAGLYLDNVRFSDVQGLFGLQLEDNIIFNISNSHFRTAPRVYADYAIDMTNAMGIIEDSTFGDYFDHVINIGIWSNVAIENVDINGSDIFYADGIRIQAAADVTIRNSTIRREHTDPEPAGIGVAHNPPYAGVQAGGYTPGGSSMTIEISSTTISGYDVGIATNIEGMELIAFDNDISAITYPIRISHQGYTETPYPTIDLGGGSLGSPGRNIIRNVGTYGINHLGPYEVYACFNEWQVPDSRIDPDRIYDSLDDSSSGRVRWMCGSGPPPDSMDSEVTPEVSLPPTATAIQNANCRKGPGAAYELHDFFYEGQSSIVEGRNADSTWVWLLLPDIAGHCWIITDVLEIYGLLDPLPIVAAPALPEESVGEDKGEGAGEETQDEGQAGGGGPTSPPAAPSNLAVTNQVCNSNNYDVTLSWFDGADNESGFKVYRDGNLIDTLGANKSTYTDQPPYGGPYTYSVEAYNDAGASSQATTIESGCLP